MNLARQIGTARLLRCCQKDGLEWESRGLGDGGNGKRGVDAINVNTGCHGGLVRVPSVLQKQ